MAKVEKLSVALTPELAEEIRVAIACGATGSRAGLPARSTPKTSSAAAAYVMPTSP